MAETMYLEKLYIAKHGLHMLFEALGLSRFTSELSSLSDVVIIAIDFENVSTIKSGFSHKENCQAGLAILDTKDLRQTHPSKLISTYNFATGSPSHLSKASNKFLFGKSAAISQLHISNSIESLLPKDRNILFVGHGFNSYLQVLRALDVKFPRRLLGILDTFNVANEVLEFWAGSLGDLLMLLGCPYNSLHCAGNDAHFTLRALLLLAVRGFNHQKQQSIGGEQEKILDILQEIATHPIPYRADPEIEAIKKREERLEKSRKHQSKSWDKEEQDRIRAARAHARAEQERIDKSFSLWDLL